MRPALKKKKKKKKTKKQNKTKKNEKPAGNDIEHSASEVSSVLENAGS